MMLEYYNREIKVVSISKKTHFLKTILEVQILRIKLFLVNNIHFSRTSDLFSCSA